MRRSFAPRAQLYAAPASVPPQVAFQTSMSGAQELQRANKSICLAFTANVSLQYMDVRQCCSRDTEARMPSKMLAETRMSEHLAWIVRAALVNNNRLLAVAWLNWEPLTCCDQVTKTTFFVIFSTPIVTIYVILVV
jgi:hypothetical protein